MMKLHPLISIVLSSFAFCGCGAAGQATAPVASGSSQGREIISRAVVFDYGKVDPYDRTNLYGFNHAPSITRLSDGRLMCAWFAGPYEGSVHQVILSSHSSDDGATWTPVDVFFDAPRKSDFDPSFLTDGQRTWAFQTAGRWNRYPFVGIGEVAKNGVGELSYAAFGRYTDDGGKTWSEPRELDAQRGVGVRSNGIRLSSGELIVPRHNYKAYTASISKSTDGGRTWRGIEAPKPDPKVGAAEPCIVETSSGELLMVVRSRDGFLWTTRSIDKGDSWSTLTKSDLPAATSSHSVIRLTDGRLLLTHNPSPPPERNPLTVRTSSDDGKTWAAPIEIARAVPLGSVEDAWSSQVSYPSAVELPDGSVGIVWTEIVLAPQVQSGVIRFARLRVK